MLSDKIIEILDNILEKAYRYFVFGVIFTQIIEVILFVVGVLGLMLKFFEVIDITWLKAFIPFYITIGSLVIRQSLGSFLNWLSTKI